MAIRNWQMWRMLLLTLAVVNAILLLGIEPLGITLTGELIAGINAATILGFASIGAGIVLYKLTDGKLGNMKGWQLLAWIAAIIFVATAFSIFEILIPAELFGFETMQLLGVGNAVATYIVWKKI